MQRECMQGCQPTRLRFTRASGVYATPEMNSLCHRINFQLTNIFFREFCHVPGDLCFRVRSEDRKLKQIGISSASLSAVNASSIIMLM